MIEYRWIEGENATDEDWERVEGILAARGWMSLNRSGLTRIRVAEEDGKLAGFYCLQMSPHAEPLYVAPAYRATGVADALADDMLLFLTQVHARGWFIVADSKFAEQMCEARGMRKLESPVYVMGGA
jgi:GNAT superfamily N-acetyltransferase